MRDKETLQDYRFMPEPNLPPIKLFDDSDSVVTEQDNNINIDRLREKLPSLPAAERHKLMNKYGITYAVADRLVVIILNFFHFPFFLSLILMVFCNGSV